MASFGGLNIAYTGLNAHQKRIDVIGENITNVNTPGYHRQRVELSPVGNPTRGVFAGVSRQGGVDVEAVTRLRDRTLSAHARLQGGVAAARSEAAETLRRLEQIVGGLDPGGLHDQMSALFNGFDDLAAAPEDPAMRQVVLERATSLAQGFTRTAGAIDQLRAGTEDQLAETVRSINSLSERIATVDNEILGALTVDADPNVLLDKRDLMVAELATLADVDVVETTTGQVTVSLDGHLLVSNGRAGSVTIETSLDPDLGALGYGRVAVVDGSGRELTVAGGSLSSQLSALSTTIPAGRVDLDAAAADLAAQVNTIHRSGTGLDGSTGLDLFEIGPNPGELRVSPDVAGRPEKLAAAAAGAGQLDNTIARSLAQLSDSATGPLAGFVQTVGALASTVASAIGIAESAEAASDQAESLALSAGGVGLDEELTDLITAQRSYEASARLMTAIDEMLQTLMSTGLVGR